MSYFQMGLEIVKERGLHLLMKSEQLDEWNVVHRGIVILFSVHNDVLKIHLLTQALIPHEL
jgi:hypothetical protein